VQLDGDRIYVYICAEFSLLFFLDQTVIIELPRLFSLTDEIIALPHKLVSRIQFQSLPVYAGLPNGL
jgi:hypothetical protein